MRTSLKTLVVLVLLLAAGCGGGESVVPPPLITSVTPTGIVGAPGASITFTANTPGPISTWAWDFGGGVRPNQSQDQTPVVNLWEPGVYSATLTVTTPEGASETLAFDLEVVDNGPGWATSLVSVVGVGLDLHLVDEVPVVARSAFGLGHQILRGVGPFPDGPEDWQVASPDADLEAYDRIRVINGRLMILGRADSNPGKGNIAVATTALPSGPTDWALYHPDDWPADVVEVDLSTIDGNPAVILKQSSIPDDFLLARANVAVPLTPADWGPLATTVFIGLGAIYSPRLLQQDDHLIMAFSRPNLPGNPGVEFAVSAGLTPPGSQDWAAHLLAPDANPFAFQLFLIEGRPVINNGPTLYIATSPSPNLITDWTSEPSGLAGAHPVLHDGRLYGTRGNLALFPDPQGPRGLQVTRARVPLPRTEADWDQAYVALDEPHALNPPYYDQPPYVAVNADGRIYVLYSADPVVVSGDNPDHLEYSTLKLAISDGPWPE